MPSSHPTPSPCQWFFRLASALDCRSAARLVRLFLGAVLARGRRTVTTWIRAAGLSAEFRPCYTAVAAAGKRADRIAGRLAYAAVKPLVGEAGRLTFALDDTPTERYGPRVQGRRHPPQPGPRSVRRPFRVRSRLGGARAARGAPGLGRGRPAAAGPAVRPT